MFATQMPPGTRTFRAEMTDNTFGAQLVVELGTETQVAAQFPKSYRVRGNTLHRETHRSLTEIPAGLSSMEVVTHPAYGHEMVGLVAIDVRFAADRVNGGANEAGLRRAKAFLVKAEQLGYTVRWMEPGDKVCPKATRYGGGGYTVSDGYLTRTQAESRLFAPPAPPDPAAPVPTLRRGALAGQVEAEAPGAVMIEVPDPAGLEL